jgi:hypothetical protein
MCVVGENIERTNLTSPSPKTAMANGAGILFPQVRVRVLGGSVLFGSLPVPDPQNPGPTDRSTDPTASWCVQGVPVPWASGSGSGCGSGSGPSATFTVVAWLFDQNGNLIDTNSTSFCGSQDPSAQDCCQLGPCGSGSKGTQQLQAQANLQLTVPDGPNTGTAMLTPTGPAVWSGKVGGAPVALRLQPDSLVIESPPGNQLAVARVEWRPFSAVFPAPLFASTADIVVTQ